MMELITNYFLPLTLAYGVPCFLWFMLYKFRPSVWPTETIVKPKKPVHDLLFGLAAVVGIFALGQLWRAGFLIPNGSKNPYFSLVIWWLNNLIIYSPIFIVVVLRKQSLSTVFLSVQSLPIKIAFGLLAAVIGVELYMILNGAHAGSVLKQGLDYKNVKNFLPVFLEGVALAFLFVRLKWVVGLKWAVAIPAILFSLGHIPRAVAEGSSIELMIVDSLLTALITVMVFTTTAKSRDMIWLGILHYFLDIAIGAFS